MAPVRLRHPKGVSTLQVPFDRDDFTVLDLQQEIYAVSDILPSRQNLKSGYPPRPMTLIPELPLSSLGLSSGEQIIVSENADPGSRGPFSESPSKTSQSAPAPAPSAGSNPSSNSRPIAPTATPAPSSRPAPKSNIPDHVETAGGVLVHRIVPDDNSCLFSAVALIFDQDISKAPQMRKIVADGIRNDPEKYNEAILGMPPSQYIKTILNPSTWGGAIELGILAAHYNTEIASIDVETSRIDHFSSGAVAAGEMRCVLIYSGIHYDAATLAPMVDAPSEWHQTVFSVNSRDDESDAILVAAKKLAGLLRAKKAYTNTSTFDLKCEDCGQGLKGEKGARAHAEQTGHVRFGEY